MEITARRSFPLCDEFDETCAVATHVTAEDSHPGRTYARNSAYSIGNPRLDLTGSLQLLRKRGIVDCALAQALLPVLCFLAELAHRQGCLRHSARHRRCPLIGPRQLGQQGLAPLPGDLADEIKLTAISHPSDGREPQQAKSAPGHVSHPARKKVQSPAYATHE